MKNFLLIFVSVFLLACGGGPVQTLVSAPDKPILAAPAWELVWQDEFEGTGLDHGKWLEETGGDGWGNHELQFYTRRSENLRVKDGMLVIEARQEDYSGRAYTSARIKTAGLQETTYGRFEARIKIPAGQGIWPAFWLLGNNLNAAGWPGCGEIDIMENIGKEPAVIHGTMHGPGYSGAKGYGQPFALSKDQYADDFHVFALEWEATEVRWYMDGVQYFSARPQQLAGQWVFDHPFFIILNLAVGGDWPGSPDATSQFPQQMLVDYVRVYRRKLT
ncbi:glycoside hydrolase family 16 protein [Undibacterium sp. TJN19]|uniref:glycoside hydrolase family 16 protein n=1 Tax=Undibacterium sp. TJN19 TaxID=3413055 RepID=UPI003BEFFCC3